MLWPYDAATQSYNIPVCWEFGSVLNSTPAERTLVQNAVTNTWQRSSLVKFTSWSVCNSQATPSVIRILIDNVNPPRAALGTEGRNKVGVMRLDFKMNTPYRATNDPGYPLAAPLAIFARCQRDNPGSTLANCLQSQAIHEFGHVLGLAHEQNRPDDPSVITSGTCHFDDNNPTNLPQGSFSTFGNTRFTDYDPDSMMNYCRNRYYGRTDLSELDKLAVRVYYGKIPTYDSRTGIFTLPRIQRYDGAILTGSFKFVGGAGQGIFQRIGSLQPTTTPSIAPATLDAAGVLRMPVERSINTAGHVCIVASVTLLPISPGLYQNRWIGLQPTQFSPECA